MNNRNELLHKLLRGTTEELKQLVNMIKSKKPIPAPKKEKKEKKQLIRWLQTYS